MSYITRRSSDYFKDLYYNQKMSIAQIAKIDGVTSTTVRKAFKHYGITPRKRKKISQEIKEAISVDYFNYSMKPMDIVKKYNIPEHVVRSITNPKNFNAPPVTKQTLEEMYFDKEMSGVDIGRFFSVHSSTVYWWFKYYDIDPSQKMIPFHRKVTKAQLQELIKSHSCAEIGNLFNVDTQVVHYTFNYYQIDIPKPGEHSRRQSVRQFPEREKLYDKQFLEQYMQDGGTPSSLAIELNCNLDTIRNNCERFAIKWNPNCSSEEFIIQKFLKQLNVEFLQNDRKVLKNGKELDFVIPSAKLAIEVNGRYWHSELQDRMYPEYHKDKTQSAMQQEYSLFQIWDDEIQDPVKLQIIKQKILYKLGKIDNRIYARQTTIKNDPLIYEQREFLNRTHIQGFRGCSITSVLTKDGEIVAMMGFNQIGDYQYELVRFSTSCAVIGGFSKLLKNFQKIHPEWKTIHTFANMRFSSLDNVYEKTGFDLAEWTRPNYFYTKDLQNLSRYQCQKHKLKKVLGENFNPNISEHDNMRAAGWARVYDSGHLKYILTNKQR